MENIALWLTVFGGSILTFAGWIINRLVTNRIDDLEKGRKEDRDLKDRVEDIKTLILKNFNNPK